MGDEALKNPLRQSVDLRSTACMPLDRKSASSPTISRGRPRAYGSNGDVEPLRGPSSSPVVQFKSCPAASIIDARNCAVQSLSMCRTKIIALELARLRNVRVGQRNRFAFWRRIYQYPLAQDLIGCVQSMCLKIDKLYKKTARKLCETIYRIEQRVQDVRTDAGLKCIWQQMEQQISRYRNIRQLRVQSYFDRLKKNFEKIPINITDDHFDELTQSVFALDPFGEYYRGRITAEYLEEHDLQTEADHHLRDQPDVVDRPGFNMDFLAALRQQY